MVKLKDNVDNKTQNLSTEDVSSVSSSNYRDRYKKIKGTDWFERNHENMSLGEIIKIKETCG